ncbi:MAG: HTH-type transcriptional regulator/antitoxin HigA [Rubritalea sp.]|jgi:HTH-type transcriptional regulator/antitoxin HigA
MKKLIKTENEYNTAMDRHLQLMLDSPDPGTEAFDELELLTLLIQTYEQETVNIDSPTPVEAIKFRMEQEGLKQKDLIAILGNKARVSEVLNGKRPLTIAMARRLNIELGIPAQVLLNDQTAEIPQEIDTSAFPVKEMHKLGWFPHHCDKTWTEAKIYAEDMLHSVLKHFKDDEIRAFNRAGFKKDAQLDDNALYAWRCKTLLDSEKKKLTKFDRDDLTEEFTSSLAKLSQFPNGPKMAIDLLEQRGIAVIINSHLPKTYLDGAALLNKNGNPLIGMTLRHDRLDNFWFTLFHELGHIKLHLHEHPEGFYDDSESGDNSYKEHQANEFALDSMIPKKQWQAMRNSTSKTAQIRLEAKRLAIHPAIIAGRLRKEFQSYSKFKTLIGQGEVRKLLRSS